MSSRILDALLGRTRNAEDPTKPLTDESLLDWLGRGWSTDSGESVTPAKALRMTAVYRAIALLSGLTGSLPLKAYRPSGEAREPVASPVIENPNPDKTPMEIWEFIGQSLFSWGNGYTLKLRDGMGRIRELWELEPGKMRVERKTEWRTDANPSGKKFFYSEGATEKVYTPWEVLHIPGLSYDGIVGLSPIGLAKQAVGLGMAAERFAARMYERGALVDGVLQTDEKLKDDSVAKRIKQQWKDKTSGPDRQWDIPVLDSGLKFERIQLPPAEAQFVEVRKFSIQEIARLYGVPPHLLGDVERSTSWGTGIEQQNMQMLTFTLDPWLVKIEQRISKELLPSGVYARFTRAALLRADTAARYLAYQRAISHGWMNADEIRSMEEMSPLPDGEGQTFYRPTNLQPVNPDQEPEENDE